MRCYCKCGAVFNWQCDIIEHIDISNDDAHIQVTKEEWQRMNTAETKGGPNDDKYHGHTMYEGWGLRKGEEK